MPRTSPREVAGPTPLGLAALLVAGAALLATGAPIPSLSSHMVGEAILAPGETVERELRVHLDPPGGRPTTGHVSVRFQSALGLSTAYSVQATLELTEAHDATGSFDPATDAGARCIDGCDLVYRLAIRAGPAVLPASVARYVADVEFRFGNGPSQPDPAWLRTDLDGTTTGVPSPLWAYLAGVIALIAGGAAGPAVARRLGPRWERRSAHALIVVLIAPLVWLFVTRLLSLLPVLDQVQLGSPLYVLFLVDPWSVGLLGTLAWGVWHGLRRRPADGGWLLGLAAVAAVGLGGLWLGDLVGEAAIVQPIAAALAFAVLGGLGGSIIGDAWRTDARAAHDRGWAAAAILSHGIVIAGFGYLAMDSIYSPFGNPSALLALVPAAVLAILLRRWFRGGRAVLILVDLIIAGIGVLGAWATAGLGGTFGSDASSIELQNVGVTIAVVASVVALISACYPLRRPGDDGPPPAPQPSVATA
jgi:hypothetical protein